MNLANYKTYEWVADQQLEQPREFSKRRDDVLDQQIKSRVDLFSEGRASWKTARVPDLKISYAVRSPKRDPDRTRLLPGAVLFVLG